MSLKELTAQNHIDAEKHPFTVKLISGELSKEAYLSFLFNQYFAYRNLEVLCDLTGLESLQRAELIEKDITELNTDGQNLEIFKETADYVSYLAELTQEQLLAHIYVRHMGDMYGGQLIKTKIPGSGAMYDFENRKELIEALRSKLDDSMADEANKCFSMILKLFDRLADEYNL